MKQKITMERLDDHVNFKASNSFGNSIVLDGSENIGGKGNGVRPMETLLMAMAGCAGIDVVLILKKMKQVIDDIKVDIEADVKKVEDYKEYSQIHAHFKIWGDIKLTKAEKAVGMSIEKYCSVSKTLSKTAEITWSVEVINE